MWKMVDIQEVSNSLEMMDECLEEVRDITDVLTFIDKNDLMVELFSKLELVVISSIYGEKRIQPYPSATNTMNIWQFYDDFHSRSGMDRDPSIPKKRHCATLFHKLLHSFIQLISVVEIIIVLSLSIQLSPLYNPNSPIRQHYTLLPI